MKRILTCLIMASLNIVAFAQKDVTKFLGIPIDGNKSEMKQKLIAKGYVPKKEGDTNAQYITSGLLLEPSFVLYNRWIKGVAP